MLSIAFIAINAKPSNTQPGALMVSMNSTSLRNMFNTFLPVLAYYKVNNRTYDIDFIDREGGGLYDFNLDKIKVIEATGFTQKKF